MVVVVGGTVMVEDGDDGEVARDGLEDEIDDTEWVGARVRRRVGTVVELVLLEEVAVFEGAKEETLVVTAVESLEVGTDVVVGE